MLREGIEVCLSASFEHNGVAFLFYFGEFIVGWGLGLGFGIGIG